VGQHVPEHHHVQGPGLQAGLLGPALSDGDIAEAGGGDQGRGGGDPCPRHDAGRFPQVGLGLPGRRGHRAVPLDLGLVEFQG
jgi:hypothetical protein